MNEEKIYEKAIINMIGEIHNLSYLKRIYKLVSYLYKKKADS